MEALDRLVWAAGLSFASHGLHIGVRVSDPAILEEVRKRLPAGARLSQRVFVDHLVSLVVGGDGGRAGVRRFHLLYAAAQRVSRTIDRQDLLLDLERHLEQVLVERAPERLFVHAGVVGWRGRAIVIPGASHSGKTTLVQALMRAGATYYSDEYAVLDPQGRVHAYPRPLQVRRDSDAGVKITARELGGRTGREPLPVGLVVLAPYRARAAWRPTRLSPGQAVLEILHHVPRARLAPRSSLNLLRSTARRAVVLRGWRGEADAMAAWLLDALEPKRRARLERTA